MALAPVAVQMYTLRDLTKDDFEGTLRAAADVGYKGIELAGFPDMPAEQFRILLNELDVQAAGAHISLQLLEEQLDAMLTYCVGIDCHYVVCPFLPETRRRSGTDYRNLGRQLDEIGARCQQHGLQFCYHNHAFEFERFDGRFGMEILLEATDPALVQWEVDAFWVEKAGVNASDMIRAYSGRCPLIHLKDMTKDESKTFAEVGEGSVDFRPIFAAGDAGGAAWYIVEQDRCQRPPLESVRISLQHLKEWGRA